MDVLRIKITLQKENFTLPIAYKHILQATIYNMLPKETIGDFYHNQGYRDQEKVFKLFVYSELLGKYTIENASIIFEKDVVLYISAIDEALMKQVYQFLMNNHYLFIHHQKVNIISVDIQQLHPFVGDQEVILRTLSAVTAYTHQEHFFTYYKPSDEMFQKLVDDNLLHKMTSYQYPINHVLFDIQEVLYEKKVMSKFKNTFYESYHTKLRVKTNFETLNMVYNTGLSNKGSCGFGMIEVVDEKNHISL